jgi:epoxyqueuosine reductase
MGDWIFGCDICQIVCPWNNPDADQVSIPEELQPRQELLGIDLPGELNLNQEEFRARFKGSPIKRAKRRGYLRNVAIALGNSGDLSSVPALKEAQNDPEPLVREAATWALDQLKE